MTKVCIKKQKTNIWASTGALGNGEEWVLEADDEQLYGPSGSRRRLHEDGLERHRRDL